MAWASRAFSSRLIEVFSRIPFLSFLSPSFLFLSFFVAFYLASFVAFYLASFLASFFPAWVSRWRPLSSEIRPWRWRRLFCRLFCRLFLRTVQERNKRSGRGLRLA